MSSKIPIPLALAMLPMLLFMSSEVAAQGFKKGEVVRETNGVDGANLVGGGGLGGGGIGRFPGSGIGGGLGGGGIGSFPGNGIGGGGFPFPGSFPLPGSGIGGGFPFPGWGIGGGFPFPGSGTGGGFPRRGFASQLCGFRGCCLLNPSTRLCIRCC